MTQEPGSAAPAYPDPSFAAAARLGFRLLSVAGPRRWWSMTLVTVGVAVVVVGVLVCVAAATVVDQRAARTEARGLVFALDDESADGWATVRRFPFEDRMVLRVDVDPRDLRPPPGVDRWPGNGEVVASPAFLDLLRADGVASYAPGTVVGVVGPEGLRAPDELVVYRGVPREDQPRGGRPVTDDGPGAPDRDTADIGPGQVAGLVGLLTVLVGLPVLAFLAVAARLSAATRARRLGALHLLGAPPSFIRRVNAVEVVLLTLAGWALGTVTYPLVNVLVARSGVLGATWFPQDTALRSGWAVVLLMGVVAFAVVVVARTDIGTGLTRVTVRAPAARASVSLWRLAPLAVGVTSLVAQVAVGARRPDGAIPVRMDAIMLTAIVVTALGLVVGAPALVRVVGDAVAARGRSLGARLGGSRAAFDPSAAGRLVTALVLVVLAAGVMIGQTRDARAVSVPVSDVVPVTVSGWELPDGAVGRVRDLTDAPVLAVVSGDSGQGRRTTVVVAECGDLSRTGPGRADGCVDGSVYLTPGADAARVEALVPGLPAGTVVSPLPVHLAAGVVDGGFDALVTVAPDRVVDSVPEGPVEEPDGSVVYEERVTLVVLAGPATTVEVIGAVLAAAPYSQPTAVGLDPDSGAHIAMINGFVRLGLALGALVTVMALITALSDRASQRRRSDLELMLAGADPGVVRSAHRWEVAVTVSAGALVATVCGILGGLAWQYAGGLVREPDWASIVVLVTATVLTCAATVLAASAAAPRGADLQAMRTE